MLISPRLTGALPVVIVAAWAGTAAADPCEAPLPRRGAVFEGVVRYVGDGDGLCVDGPAGLIEVRLQDFSAPELSEPDGRAAKAALERVALGRRVRCTAANRSWDRIVATCWLVDGPRAGWTIGRALRAEGVREGGR